MILMQPYLQSSNGTILGVCGFGPRQLVASFSTELWLTAKNY